MFAAVGCLSVVVFSGAGLYAAVESRLQQIEYEARVVSVAPQEECVEFAHSMGTPVLRTLQRAIKTVPFEVELDPERLEPRPKSPNVSPAPPPSPPEDTTQPDNKPSTPKTQHLIPPEQKEPQPTQHLPSPASSSTSASPRDTSTTPPETKPKPHVSEAPPKPSPPPEEPTCTARVGVAFQVRNPLAVPVRVEIVELDVKVMKQPLSADQVQLASQTLQADGDAMMDGTIFFTFHTDHILAASGGLLMRRKVQFYGVAKVVVSVFGGFVQRTLTLPVEREITIAELLASIQGTIQAH